MICALADSRPREDTIYWSVPHRIRPLGLVLKTGC